MRKNKKHKNWKRQIDHMFQFKAEGEDDTGADGGAGMTQPKGQAVETNPIPPVVVPDTGAADKLKALELSLERERKAREKLERERDEAADAKKTELERAQELASVESKKRADAEARLTGMLRESALRDAVALIGVRPDRISAVLRVADLSAITVDDSGAMVGASATAETIKKDFPEFFGNGAPGSTANPNSGAGKPGDRSAPASDEFENDYDLGKALAAAGKKKKTRL
jgi:hypothetical protein